MAYEKISYNNAYNKQHYEEIKLRLPMGQKELLRAAADAAGLSVNAYILQAVQAYQSSQSK